LDDPGLKGLQEQEIFFLSKLSRPALGPIKLPIQRVLAILSLTVKQPIHEVDHSPKKKCCCTSATPRHLCGVDCVTTPFHNVTASTDNKPQILKAVLL